MIFAIGFSLLGLFMVGAGVVWLGGVQALAILANVALVLLGALVVVLGIVGMFEESKSGRR